MDACTSGPIDLRNIQCLTSHILARILKPRTSLLLDIPIKMTKTYAAKDLGSERASGQHSTEFF